MNINTKYELKRVRALTQYNVFTNIIKLVNWSITIYDLENPNDVTVTVDVTTKLNYERCELNNFKEFSQLRKSDILEFAVNAMGGSGYLETLKQNHIPILSRKKEELELVDLNILTIPD